MLFAEAKSTSNTYSHITSKVSNKVLRSRFLLLPNPRGLVKDEDVRVKKKDAVSLRIQENQGENMEKALRTTVLANS